MSNLLTDIDAYISRGTVVFPSQIAAEFWRRKVIHDTDRVAVREDRLISWDTFKETAFEIRQENVPTNRTIRTVFAQRFIRENAQQPLLRELVPPAFAAEAQAFTTTIESVLPRIPAALKAMRGAQSGRLGRIRADLEVLESRYTAFMNDHGLFEPRWLETRGRFRGGDYLLVAPELADDFPEFQLALSDISMVNLTGPLNSDLMVYADSRSEMRAVLSRIAELLDSGVDPEEIYLTVGDLENLADRLRQEGEKYHLPLLVRAGRTLADSAVGRFIQCIGDVVSSGFAVGAIERLILNRGIPWRDPAHNATLVLSGVECGAIGGTSRPDPRWSRTGKSSGGRKPALIDHLRRLLPGITGAQSFGDLRRLFNELLSQAVVRSGWSVADERVLERSQEELRTLVAVEVDTGLVVDNPYRFWLDRLGEHPYVPQQRDAGVAVLPYRVGAATCPGHHLVMNTTHSASTVVVRSFPFLSEADREELGPTVSDRDLSAAFLSAYSVSGESVSFTAARSTFEGPALPAGLFVSTGRKTEAPAEQVASQRANDRFHAEESFHPAEQPAGFGDVPRGELRAAGGAAPGELSSAGGVPLPLQVHGASEYILGARADTGPDFTRDAIDDLGVREAVLQRVRSKSNPELIVLSASHIDTFRACPFGYLLSRCLRMDELTLEVRPDDPLEIGRLYHDILAAFFDELARTGTPFHAANLPALQDSLSEIANTLYKQSRGMIPNVVYDANRETFDRIAAALLEHDAELIGGHTALLIEAWQQEQETQDGFVLVGRVDRVTRAPDGSITLVDYKKSTLPTRVSVNAGSESATGVAQLSESDRLGQIRSLGSVQIPLYVRLLEAGGHKVTAAGYFGLESARYLSVFNQSPGAPGKPCMNRERLDEVVELVDGLVSEVANRVNAGDFTCNDECSGCSFRSVCRTQFYVR